MMTRAYKTRGTENMLVWRHGWDKIQNDWLIIGYYFDKHKN